MMGLGPYIGREYAHDLVYDICREAVKQQRPLLDLLAEHPEINKHLDRAALAKLLRPGQLPRPVRRDGRPRARHAALKPAASVDCAVSGVCGVRGAIDYGAGVGRQAAGTLLSENATLAN